MDCLPTSTDKKRAVFVFGRFQPPTIGHAILLKQMENKMASGEYDGYICLSKTKNFIPLKTVRKGEDKVKYDQFTRDVRVLIPTKENRNPLTAETRIKFMKLMHPNTPVKFINGETCGYTSRIFINKLKELGYTDITLLVGSDRVESFAEYASEVWIEKVGDDRTGEFKGSSATGMSGTIMRNAAIRGDFDLFKRGTKMGSMTDANVKELMDYVRLGLGFNTLLRDVRVTNRRNTRFVWPKQFKKTRATRKTRMNSSGAKV